VIGCCGDLKELQSAGKQQTLKQMRRNLVHSTQRSRGSIVVSELEMQVREISKFPNKTSKAHPNRNSTLHHDSLPTQPIRQP